MKRAIWLFLLTANIAFAQKQVSYLTTEPVRSNNPEAVKAGFATHSVIPFEIKNGMIILQGTLDGKKGCFILDTGAPQLVVNQTRGEGVSTRQANSCNGSFTISLVEVNEFIWAGGAYRDLQAISLDLAHLERELKCCLLGIIGYEQIKGFELLLDYRKGQLMLFNPDGGRLHRVASPDFTLGFTLESHVPVITLHSGSRSLRFGLDTGAEGNLVDQQVLESLSSRTIREEELRGLDQTVRMVPVVRLPQLMVSSMELDSLDFLATDFSHIREKDGIAIDGLLGFPFFENAIISINYDRQKLFIWDSSQESF